jgi:(1->4)-alpha-D-glucan 1-alpha-D-glucosylmutase
VLGDEKFVTDLEGFVASITMPGRINSLTQTLLKYTSPGVPDLYQGSELWDLSLVDPDNRRPVDYTLRARLLKEVKGMTAAQVMDRMDDGLPKLWLVHQALTLRGGHAEWFGADASYQPVLAKGTQARRVVAYLRAGHVLTVAPRWNASAEAWGDTAIDVPAGSWTNQLTGEMFEGGTQPVETIFAGFPVALLVLQG